MNEPGFRQICLLAPVHSPLVVSSCSTHHKDLSVGKNGLETVRFHVQAWHYTPARGASVASALELSAPLPESDTIYLSSRRVIDIPQRLSRAGKADLLLEGRAGSYPGVPVIFSSSGTEGQFGASLTSYVFTRAGIMDFDIIGQLPFRNSDIPEDKFRLTGRINLNAGETILTLHAVRDGWLIWLISREI